MIYIAGLPSSAIEILTPYFDKYFPDDEVDDLSTLKGINARLRNIGYRPDIKLIIIGSDVYDRCYEVAKNTLDLPKSHRYTDDDNLKLFLLENFGSIDETDTASDKFKDLKGSVIGTDELPDVDSLVVGADESNELDEELKSLRDTVAKQDDVIADLNVKIMALTEGVGYDEDGNSFTLTSKIKELEEEIKSKQGTIDELNNDLFSYKEKATKFDVISDELTEVTTKLALVEKSKADLELQFDTLKGELENTEGVSESLETKTMEFERLEIKYTELQTEKAKLDARVKELTDSQIELQNSISELNAKNKVLRQEVSTKETLAKRVSELEQQYSDAQADVANLRTQLTAMEELRTQIATLQVDLETVTNERNNALRRIEECEVTISARETAIANLETEHKGYLNTISEQNSKIDTLNSSVDALNASLAENEQSLQSIRANTEKLQSKIAKLSSQNENLSNDLDTAHKEKDLANAEVARVNAKVDELREEVAEVTGVVKDLNAQIDTLQSEKKELSTQLDSANDDMTKLTEQLNNSINDNKSKSEEVTELLDEVKSKTSEISSLNKELNELSADYQEKLDKCNSLADELDTAKEKIVASENMVAILRVQLQDASQQGVEVDTLNQSLTDVTEELSSSREEVKSLNDKLSSLNEELYSLKKSNDSIKAVKEGLENEVATYKKEIQSLNDASAESDKEIKGYQETIQSLSDDANALKASLAEVSQEKDKIISQRDKLLKDLEVATEKAKTLEESVNQLTQSSTSSSVDLANVKKRLARREKELEQVNEDLSHLQEDLNTTNTKLSDKMAEYSILKRDYDDCKSQLDTIRQESTAGNTEVARLTGLVEEYDKREKVSNQVLSAKESEIKALDTRVKQLTGEIGVLREGKAKVKLLEAKVAETDTTIALLEKNITGFKSRIAELTQELVEKSEELTKLSSDTSMATEIGVLRTRITELEDKNKAVQVDSETTINAYKSRLELSQADVAKLRREVSSGKALLKSKSDEIEEMKSGIFMAMSGTTLPRSVMNLSLGMHPKPYKNMYVFASGSADSSVALYQLLSRQVSQKTGTSFLIVDLVTDSYIDRELGAKPRNVPFDWLQGTKPVDGFLAPTKFTNTQVMTMAFSYMNDLFLLTVDWDERFKELSTKADIVIINVGNIGNIVHDILYNSFTQVMRGIVVVKATPINLRTALFNLTGFQGLVNTLVACTGYSERTSKGMFEKLSAKFSTKILADNEILLL